MRISTSLLTGLLVLSVLSIVPGVEAQVGPDSITWNMSNHTSPEGDGSYLSTAPPTGNGNTGTCTLCAGPSSYVTSSAESSPASPGGYVATGSTGEATVYLKSWNFAPAPMTKVAVEILAGSTVVATGSAVNDVLLGSIVEYTIPLSYTGGDLAAGTVLSWDVSIGDDTTGAYNPAAYPRSDGTVYWSFTLPLQPDAGPNTAPTAALTPSTIKGDAPAEITFDLAGTDDQANIVEASFDPDGPGGVGASAFSFAATGSYSDAVTHTYDTPGSYTASLTVTDADGLSDTATATIIVSEPSEDEDDGPAPVDDDADEDGIRDDADNCPNVSNPGQADLDQDGAGDRCDDDDDADEVADVDDNCPRLANDQADLDGDGIGDACDADDDGDGAPDATDNCPVLANDQSDLDGDGAGDDCDNDDDGDGHKDGADVCPTVWDVSQADMDGDGKGDACDADIDGDGVDNAVDNCARIPNSDQGDIDGDGFGDLCDEDRDGDGQLDTFDADAGDAGSFGAKEETLQTSDKESPGVGVLVLLAALVVGAFMRRR